MCNDICNKFRLKVSTDAKGIFWNCDSNGSNNQFFILLFKGMVVVVYTVWFWRVCTLKYIYVFKYLLFRTV